MADTTETAAKASNASRASRRSQDSLEDQVAQLREDLKGITATLAKLGNDKVGEVRDTARTEARHLARAGRRVIDDVGDQAGALETQLKDAIREKPLTAIAGAIGIGFLFALLSRR